MRASYWLSTSEPTSDWWLVTWGAPGVCCHLAIRPSPLAPITPLRLLITEHNLVIISSHARASNGKFSRGRNDNDSLAWNHEIDWKLTAGFLNICRHELLWRGLARRLCLPARKFGPRVWARCVQCLAGSRDWLNVLLAIWLFALGSLVRISYRWINPELAKQPVWLVKYQISRQIEALKGILFIQHRDDVLIN